MGVFFTVPLTLILSRVGARKITGHDSGGRWQREAVETSHCGPVLESLLWRDSEKLIFLSPSE